MKRDIETLFDFAAQLPVEKRAEFLAHQCADPAIRAEVESLLKYATGSESYFAGAVQSGALSLRHEHEPSPGDTIGAYRICSLIGRGGMGSVYLAERADGSFEQQVALKVVQSAQAEALLERFRQERRILGHLSHPNIARILDGGQTSGGLPYFVMEYVSGQAIDQYCDQRNLRLPERLALFVKVCDGVQHAHQNLVVHRDLKPANIFVTDQGEPKLLDFGIAKVLDPSDASHASTQVLTPDYASPEQIRGDPITTASDVYSLGAVLYKMLTGRPPHSLGDMAPLEAARVVSEAEVPAASTVRPGLPADVDSILQKALHKDVTRRYRTVEEFSSDIGRYLEGRPVLAVPDSFAYRAHRFLTRHAVIAAVSTLTALFLIVSAAVSIDQARRAQRRFQQVRQLANVFLFDFDRSIQDLPGSLAARKLVASTAQRYLEQLSAESGGDPGLQREIAEAYQRLSEIQIRLKSGGGDDVPGGVESLLKAYEIHRRLGDDKSPDAKLRRKFIDIASLLAGNYQQSNSAAESAKWSEEASRLAEEWVSSEPQRPEALEAARLASISHGLQLKTSGHVTQAREAFERAVQFAERDRAIGPPDRLKDYNSAVAHYMLCDVLLNLKEPSSALPHAQRAVGLMEPLHAMDQVNPKWNIVYSGSLSSTGIAYRALAAGDPKQLPLAIQYLERAHSVALEMMRQDAQHTGLKDNLIVQCNRLARALMDAGKQDTAAPLYEEAVKASRELIELNPKNRRNWYILAKNQLDYGTMRLDQGHIEQGRQLLLSADPAFERGLALDPHDTPLLEARATQFEKLAAAAERVGDRAGAQRRMRQCLDVVNGMVERDASAKTYITDYPQMMAFAKRLGVGQE